MLPGCGSVAGIDVGYSEKRKSSAICRFWWDERSFGWDIKRYRATDEERDFSFKSVIGSRRLLAVALDGPLRSGFDAIGEYRLAEKMLTVRLAKIIGKPGQSSSPSGKMLNAEANVCAKLIRSVADIGPTDSPTSIDSLAIIEAFPSSFLGSMLPSPVPAVTRAKRSDAFFCLLAAEGGGFSQLAQALLPGRNPECAFNSVTNHDDRAALVCAFTALCFASGNYSAVGDEKNG